MTLFPLIARSFLAVFALMLAYTVPVQAQDRFIVLASTTSTEQSGLFAHLLPRFTADTGIAVRVVALGTGQALDVARRGDADVALIHDPQAEEAFVNEGAGIDRRPVMHNDFIIVGPKSDPVGLAGLKDIHQVFRKFAQSKAPFISRGDRSGTHAMELRLWRAAGVDLNATRGDWYKETGQGMGPVLNIASAANGYTLADRGTWLNFRNRADLTILVEGDQRLFNPYSVILVNPARHAHVKAEMARLFADWLTGAKGQDAISSYRINGEVLFFPHQPPNRS
jgi:tungstate transport system substrate-binding protein